MMTNRFFCVAVAATGLITTASHASETVTYTYDALGRVTGVSHSGGANNGLQASYQYDNADNRTNVTVTGATLNSPPSRVIVVPLNGLTVIAIGSGVN